MATSFEHNPLNCLCLNLRRGARQVTQLYDAALRETGLKITQFTLLSAVQLTGRTTMTPLAEYLGMDRTTLTRNLAVLERMGLVAVAIGEQDRREQWVELTSSGAAAIARAKPLWQQAQTELTTNLGSGEARTLLRTLGKFPKSPESS